MLRKTRIVLAAVFFIGVTLLFLDFTGTLHAWLGWMAKIQFMPALLALNLGVLTLLLALTLIFGRVYCSVICPLGIMQDIISWLHGKTKKKARFRFSYSPARHFLRYGVLTLYGAAVVAGLHAVVALIAPYSAYGRIASSLLAPLYQFGNNLFAWMAERAGSYAFYSTEIWVKSGITLGVATATFSVIAILAWKHGRTWCNTICPVGSVLGFFSRFSLFAPVIDTEKCRNCGLCEKQCKASCINMKEHRIDYSRCVVCMDCIGTCKEGAMRYALRYPVKPGMTKEEPGMTKEKPGMTKEEACHGRPDRPSADQGRRTFLTTSALVIAAGALKAQEMKVDGGLADISRADKPERGTQIVPAGSISLKNFSDHCTACQLCISACPNQVLRPSTSLMTLMQPEMSYERGYCRPECTKCSEVCPAGAIRPITIEEKSSIQIGHAVINLENCVINTDKVRCGNCARHCPAGAISMVNNIPVVNEEKCIGCGACENLCPARPKTAIHVEGHEVHRYI